MRRPMRKRQALRELLETLLEGDEDESAVDALRETADTVLAEVRETRVMVETMESAPSSLLKAMDKLSKHLDGVDLVNPVLKKSLERLSAIEKAQERIASWGDGAKHTADRMVNAANALAHLDKVREYCDRPIYIVKDAAAASGVFSAVFPATSKGLEEARQLHQRTPGSRLCSGIWQGAIKIGDTVES